MVLEILSRAAHKCVLVLLEWHGPPAQKGLFSFNFFVQKLNEIVSELEKQKPFQEMQ